MENQSGGKRPSWQIKNGVEGLDLSQLPRCQAIAKSTGEPCKRTALKGKSTCGIHACRFHPGAKIGNQNALKQGFYTEKAKEERAMIKKNIEMLMGLGEKLTLLTMKFSTMNQNVKQESGNAQHLF